MFKWLCCKKNKKQEEEEEECKLVDFILNIYKKVKIKLSLQFVVQWKCFSQTSVFQKL